MPPPVSSLKQTPQATSAKRLWAFVKPHRLGFILSTLAFVLASATEPLVPAILSLALNSLGSQGSAGVGGAASSALQSLRLDQLLTLDSLPIWSIPVALVLVFIVRGSLLFVASYLLNWAGSRTVFDLRTRLVQSVIKADASLYTELNPGIAITRIVSHPQIVMTQLGGAATTLLRDGTTSIAMLCYLIFLDWQLTLVAMLVLPFMAWVIKVIHTRAKEIGGQAFTAEMQLVSCVDDIARAWRVIRTFDAGEWEHRRFEVASQKLRRSTLKGSATSSLMSPVSQLIASIGLATILGMALWRAQSGASTAGDFAAFVLAMLSLLSSVRRLTDVSQPIVSGLLTAQGCFDLIDTPPEPDHGTRTLERCDGHLDLKHVTVSYPGAETPALSALNLTIPAGQTVALVGASGSGKTTIVSALLGFVYPKSGQITLDSVDLKDLRKTSLRKQFAVVSQDIVLFEGSLADNVAYAQPRDPAKLEQCLRAANLWNFVEAQPQGWDMQVGTNGSKLSGGQRQRLAIARALYKDAPIWIFDEATSALDTESERAVQQAIEEWHGRKTLILIAHRLSTVVNADRIYVISSGKVIEAGSHPELLARNGAYASMVMAQAAT